MKISNILIFLSWVGIVAEGYFVVGLHKENAQLKQSSEQLVQENAQMRQDSQQIRQNNAEIQKAVDSSRKIYVYNLETVLLETGAVDAKKKFEKDVENLSKEVSAAEEKIKTLTDAKVKAEFSDVYLKSLRLKRDNLIEDYDKSLQNTLKKINKALSQIAVEKKAPTIFFIKSLAVMTDDVIDVSSEVVEKLKAEE